MAVIKTTLIASFAKFILGSGTFERIKAVVARMDDKDISGTEKRILAVEEVKMLGIGIANFLVGLGIELAVAYFRVLAGEKTK